MKKRLLGTALMVMALMSVMTIGASAAEDNVTLFGNFNNTYEYPIVYMDGTRYYLVETDDTAYLPYVEVNGLSGNADTTTFNCTLSYQFNEGGSTSLNLGTISVDNYGVTCTAYKNDDTYITFSGQTGITKVTYSLDYDGYQFYHYTTGVSNTDPTTCDLTHTDYFYVCDDVDTFLTSYICSDGIYYANTNDATTDDNSYAYMATVGSESFYTIEAAIEAANGETISLTRDVTWVLPVMIDENVTVVLDTNGYTVDYTGAEFALYNLGNLTITNSQVDASVGADSKTASNSDFVLSSDTAMGFIYNAGVFVAEDVTFYSDVARRAAFDYYTVNGMIYSADGSYVTLTDVNALSNATSTFSGMSAFRADSGTVECYVYGGTYYNKSPHTSYCNPYAFTSNADYAVISPDKVYGYRGCLGVNNGYTEILGGDYSSVTFRAFYFSGDKGSVECVIKGGSFTQLNADGSVKTTGQALYIANQNTGGDGGVNASAACEIEGGTFNGYIYLGAPLGTLSVSGGTFNNPDVQGSSTVTELNIMSYLEEDAEITIDTTTYNTTSGGSTFTIDSDTTIPSGATVTLAAGASLTVGNTYTLVIEDGATLNVSAGTLTNSGTIYLVGTGVIVPTQSNNGTIETIVASVTKDSDTVTYYTTLQAALDAASQITGAAVSVALTADIAEDVSYTSDRQLTLDLAGYTWTTESATAFTNNGGQFTITDSTGEGALVIDSEDTFTTNTSMYFDCAVTNNGTITNTWYLTVYDDATVTGTAIDNNLAMVYESVQADGGLSDAVVYVEEETWWGATYYYYYDDLDTGLNDGWDGCTITVIANVTLTSTISITDNLTIVGATGTETISYTGTLFTIDAAVEVTFDSLDMVISNTGIMVNEAGDESTVTITNCTITSDSDGAAYIVRGDTSVGDTEGSNYYYDLTFTGNTVTGQFQKPIHAIIGTGNTVTITGNSFTGGYDNDIANKTANRSVTIIVDYSGDTTTVVTVKDNTFDNLYKAISVDSWATTPTFTLTGNSFTNCEYSLDISSTNGYNDGLSLAYNYFDGTLPAVLDSYSDSEYSNTTNSSGLVFYPYYSDETLTTLVYEEGEKDVTEVAEETLSSDTLSNNEKADIIAAVNTDSIAEDDTLLDALNELDSAIVEENGNLDVTNSVTIGEAVETAHEVDTTAATSATVSGLAVAIFGGDATEVTATIGLEIAQTVGATTEVDGETVAVAAFSVTPYVSYDDGYTTSTVSNSELNAPVTFTLYLPDAFADTNRALVTHTEADGTVVSEDKTYVVYQDESGNPYIIITVTQFSTFDVTYTSYVSTSSGTATYSSTMADTENGTVTLSGTKNAMNSTVTISTDANTGYEVDTVTVTYASGREVSVTDNSDGTYSYSQPGASVTVTVTFVETEAETETETETAFIDVEADAYYYDAVLWAVENSITAGTNTAGTTFSPDDTCTRAQAVTFLWRAAGEPEATIENPFTDLDADEYYYEAVLWAIEMGITTGTTDTTFSPDTVCTRDQIVTFMYRAAGEPEVTGDCDFTDVSADMYYYNAVLWAVDQGITTGSNTDGTEFSPSDNCTRGQIVTFLYRYMAE